MDRPKHEPKYESELDEIAADLTAGTIGCPPEGLTYRELPVEQRIIVMQLAQGRSMDEALHAIDSKLAHVSHWFQLSRIYEP